MVRSEIYKNPIFIQLLKTCNNSRTYDLTSNRGFLVHDPKRYIFTSVGPFLFLTDIIVLDL